MEDPEHGRASAEPLSSDARAVYRYIVARPVGTASETVRSAVELTEGRLAGAVRQLLALRMLGRSAFEHGVLEAVPPDTARAQLLGPALRELDRRQSEIDVTRAAYSELTAVYEGSVLQLTQANTVEVISDLQSVRDTITELAAKTQSEVVTAQPGGARNEEVLRESLTRTDELLARGVRMRTLYQHTARFSPPTVKYVEHVTRQGAEVRTRSDGFMRLMVFDRSVAVIALRDSQTGAVIVHERNMVDFVFAAFERAWSQATDFQPTYDPAVVELTSNDVKIAITHLLVDGVEDKIIARQLGMSLRTCQRHISEIMRLLGARNRIHAGYLIHRLDLLNRQTFPARDETEPAELG
ncbi:LuxR C-terminal-related transcriptional regulator [Kitasatospora sp. McL0602]|uniref:LuxR C-terminal-related transcriptional regulator n=1 Tax=Kitasatospora sp. McL0602 TaxID=3439530 RepID=UPI003F8BDE1A